MRARVGFVSDLFDDEGGFTLLETLVSLAIVGGVVSLAALSGSDTFRRSEDLRIAARVEMELRLARSEAMRTGMRRILAFHRASRSLVRDEGLSRYKLPGEYAIDLLHAEEAVTIDGPGIVFRPDGTSSGGKLAISRGSWRRLWTVDWRTGHAKS